MNKKLLSLILALVLLSTSSVYAKSTADLPEFIKDQNVNITLNGEEIKIPESMGKPHIDSRNERTMVPIRFMAEVMGWIVEYTPDDGGTVKIDNRDVYLKFKVGSKKVEKTINGKTDIIDLDSVTYAFGNRTYVPLRFIVESMGPGVEWIQDTFTVNIITNKTKEKDVKSLESKDKTEEIKTEYKKIN